ncbi:MAG: hypothetical protein ACRC1D_03515 [Culicoidibacterales bacterium]
MKKLIAHLYRATPNTEQSHPRMSRLAWALLNQENNIVRGFDFWVNPESWGVDDEGVVLDDGYDMNHLYVVGHQPKFVLEKFIVDYEDATELHVMNTDHFIEQLIYEAKIYGVAAKSKPNRISCGKIDLDMRHGIYPLVKHIFSQ